MNSDQVVENFKFLQFRDNVLTFFNEEVVCSKVYSHNDKMDDRGFHSNVLEEDGRSV